MSVNLNLDIFLSAIRQTINVSTIAHIAPIKHDLISALCMKRVVLDSNEETAALPMTLPITHPSIIPIIVKKIVSE